MASLVSFALRNVRRHRRRSVITISVVGLGMMAVMLLRGGAGGFNALMMEEVIDGRTGAIQVHRAGYVGRLDAVPTELSFEFTDELKHRLETTPGVHAVSARVRFDGLVANGSLGLPILGRGVNPVDERRVCPAFGRDVVPGGRQVGEGDEAVLGLELGQALAIAPSGGRVSLSVTSPLGRMNALDLQVVGLSELRLPFENKRSVVVALTLAQRLLDLERRVTEVAVAIEPGARVEDVAATLRLRLGDALEVHTWKQLEPWVYDTLRRKDAVIDVVAAVLLLIVLSSIASTTTMAVHERTSEIGTLLALGLRRRQVRTLVLFEAILLGTAGAVVGGLAGSALVWALGAVGVPFELLASQVTLRPVVDVAALVFGVTACTLGTVLAAWNQARRAADLRPVDALRSN